MKERKSKKNIENVNLVMILKPKMLHQIECLFLCMIFLSRFEAIKGAYTKMHARCGSPGLEYGAKISVMKPFYGEKESVYYDCMTFNASRTFLHCGAYGWDKKTPRCPFSTMNLYVTDAECVSTSSSNQIFAYKNMTIKTASKSAYSSENFQDVKLVVNQSGTFHWKFKLSKPLVKYMVRTKFVIHNFESITPYIRDRTCIEITNMDISSYRKCKIIEGEECLNKLTTNMSVVTHICNTLSEEDTSKEAKSPPDYMTMTTFINTNLTVELKEIIFGRILGSFEIPTCEMAPVGVGEVLVLASASIPLTYAVKCAPEWEQILFPSGNNDHFRECNYHYSWKGSSPICRPKKSCSMKDIQSRLLQKPIKILKETEQKFQQSSSIKSQDPLYIETFRYFYRYSNDIVYPIIDSEVIYACNSSEYSLVGDETRKCLKNFTWSGREPRCKSKFYFEKIFCFNFLKQHFFFGAGLESENEFSRIMIILLISFIAVIILCILIIFRLNIRKNNLEKVQMKQIENEKNMNEYNSKNKNDIYETLIYESFVYEELNSTEDCDSLKSIDYLELLNADKNEPEYLEMAMNAECL